MGELSQLFSSTSCRVEVEWWLLGGGLGHVPGLGIHNYWQIRVANEHNLHVFGLWKESEGNPQTCSNCLLGESR